MFQQQVGWDTEELKTEEASDNGDMKQVSKRAKIEKQQGRKRERVREKKKPCHSVDERKHGDDESWGQTHQPIKGGKGKSREKQTTFKTTNKSYRGGRGKCKTEVVLRAHRGGTTILVLQRGGKGCVGANELKGSFKGKGGWNEKGKDPDRDAEGGKNVRHYCKKTQTKSVDSRS